MKVLLVTLNAKYIHSSLALRYLRSYCEQLPLDLAIREFTINNELLQILSEIYREEPNVVCFACYIWNIEQTQELTALLKKVLPNCIIVLGGPEVTFDPERVLTDNREIDYVIQGEGEQVLFTLLKALNEGASVTGIQGLAYREGERIITVGGPQVVSDINVLPFPYTQDDMKDLKNKIIYYETSRGCPFSCQYCLSSTTTGVRFLDVNRVLKELEFFIGFKVKQVKFVDRTFNTKKEYFLKIWQFLARQECPTNFHFEIAADLLDDEVLEFLQSVPSGRFQFEIGIQSTHEPTLREIRRKNDWEAIARNVRTLHSFENIHLHLDLIAGLPDESYARFGTSFNDVYALRPGMLQIGFLKLLRGSGIRRNANLYGYVFTDKAPYEVLFNRYITYGEMRKLKILEEVFSQIYNSGRFRLSLEWLVNITGANPFAFYSQLACYWEANGLHLAAHGSKGLFKVLAEFCRRLYPEKFEDLRQILKFDALMDEGGAVRPEFLPWNQDDWQKEKDRFWKNEQVVAKYIPDYTFTSWRDLKKNYHIEVFDFDVPNFAHSLELGSRAPTAFLFIYRHGGARYLILEPEDFFVTEDNNDPV